MPSNNPLNQWSDIVQQQAQHDSDKFEQSQNDISRNLQENIREVEQNEEIQNNTANDYQTDNYQDR